MRRYYKITALVVVIILGSASCGKDSSQSDRTNVVADFRLVDAKLVDAKPVDAKPVDAVAPDKNTAPHLTTTHSGWGKPLCLSCHDGTKAQAGHSGYRDPDCVGCHGYNGAHHKSHATTTNPNCANCHTPLHDTSMQVPADCVVCHYHPNNPDGT